jgi:hypothetical protein
MDGMVSSSIRDDDGNASTNKLGTIYGDTTLLEAAHPILWATRFQGGTDVHVSTTAASVHSFLDSDNRRLICFRCGEKGHVRFQCLNYRIRMCGNTENAVQCNAKLCHYAHSPSQLRTPWKPRCVRVVKQGGKLICIGCNSTEHTFRRCPHHQDLMFL